MKYRELILVESSNAVYYHGTNREFGKFEIGSEKANRATNITGVYFTPHQWEAEEYGQRVIQVRLHYKKLFDVQKWNEFNLAMKNKAFELLSKHTTYREEWLKKAIIPDMVEKGYFAGGLRDVSGDIKREILLVGGYDAIKDGDHIAMLTTDGIEVVNNEPVSESNDGTQEEVFHFGNKSWDVQRGYQLVKQHNIQPEMLPVDGGLASFLGFTRTNPEWAKTAKLEDPVLLIDTGKGVMVIDGYHRIKRAKDEGVAELPGYILSQAQSKEIEIVHEMASYKGNIGIMELIRAKQKAPPAIKKLLDKLIDSGRNREAWRIIQKLSGTNLVGKQFENYDWGEKEEGYDFENPLPTIDNSDVWDEFEELEGDIIEDWEERTGRNYREEYGKVPGGYKKFWKEQSVVENVPINKIICTEKWLSKEHIERIQSGESKKSDLPLVHVVMGKYYATDGNHRIVAAALNGEKSIQCDVLHLSGSV